MGPVQRIGKRTWAKEPHVLAAQIEEDLRSSACTVVRDPDFWLEVVGQIQETLDSLPQERCETNAIVQLEGRWKLVGARRVKHIVFLSPEQQKALGMLREYWHLRSDQDVVSWLLQAAANTLIALLGGHDRKGDANAPRTNGSQAHP